MVATIVSNLSRLKPSGQRAIVLDARAVGPDRETSDGPGVAAPDHDTIRPDTAPSPIGSPALLDLARATAEDGQQHGVGAQNPEELEALCDLAVATIRSLPPEDTTRFVLPWLWDGVSAGARALTAEGRGVRD